MVSFGNMYSPVIKLYNMDIKYHVLLDERQTGGNCNNDFVPSRPLTVLYIKQYLCGKNKYTRK